MSIKNRFRDSLQKDDKQSKRGTWHSKAYHRFFDGYSEITVPKPNGKGTRIQRVYTGNYYRQDLTKGQRILLRVLYTVLFLGTTYLFVSSAILPLASNSTWYVALPQAVSLPFLLWVVIALFFYLPPRKDMKIHEYRSSSPALQKATLGSAICLGITALTTIVFIVLNPSSEYWYEMLSAGKYVVAGLVALAIHQIEKKVHYLKIPNQKLPPDDSFEIN